MIAQPPDRCFSTGRLEKATLAAIAKITVNSTFFCSLAGGMIMAINIPYKAIPIALDNFCGISWVAAPPTKVPSVQPTTGVRISPAI